MADIFQQDYNSSEEQETSNGDTETEEADGKKDDFSEFGELEILAESGFRLEAQSHPTLEELAGSDYIHNRQLAAKKILESLQRASFFDHDEYQSIISVMCKLSEDEESIVRSELVQHIPSIALYCRSQPEVKIKLIISQQLVPYTVKLLNDPQLSVRKLAQSALIVLLENNLIGELQLNEWICPLIAQLAMCSSNLEEQRIEDVTVMCSMIPLVDGYSVLKFFLEPFVSLCSDHAFGIRTVCAMRMGHVCHIAGTETTESYLLPAFVNLCNDELWGVRKACADVFVQVANVVTMKTREEILPDLFINLLNDHSRYVINAAYHSLGGFIYSFHSKEERQKQDEKRPSGLTNDSKPQIERKTTRFTINPQSLEKKEYRRIKGYRKIKGVCRNVVPDKKQALHISSLDKGDSVENETTQVPFDFNELATLNRTPSDSGSHSSHAVAATKDGHVYVHVNNDNVFNNFQFWRVPLPEVELDVDIDKGKATNIHIRAKLPGSETVSTSEIRLRIAADENSGSEGPSDSGASRFQVQTACINTFAPQAEEDRLEAEDVVYYSSFKESILTFKENLVEVEDSVLSTESSENPPSINYQSLSDMDLLLTEQDIVPQKLLSKYIEAANKSSWDAVLDDEIVAHCAFSFPAVAYTLGSKYWPCIRHTCLKLSRNLKWIVRRTIASSLHELAAVLGSDITAADLRPIFLEFLKDVDEVRLGLVLHLSGFLKHLSSEDRSEFLPDMEEFSKTDNERNWRYRCTIAEQLIPTMDLYESIDVHEYFLPIAMTLLRDKVFAVRIAAAELIAVLVKRLLTNPDARNAVLAELDTTFRQAHKWNARQTYVFICEQLAKKGSLTMNAYVEEITPNLFQLVYDPVDNVRLAVSRCMALTLLPLDYLPILKEARYLWKEVIYVLQEDTDEDVRYFARISSKVYNDLQEVCSFCLTDLSAGGEGFLAPVGDKGKFKNFCSQQCMEQYGVQEYSPCKKQESFKTEDQVDHQSLSPNIETHPQVQFPTVELAETTADAISKEPIVVLAEETDARSEGPSVYADATGATTEDPIEVLDDGLDLQALPTLDRKLEYFSGLLGELINQKEESNDMKENCDDENVP